jgi:hypothetical protein
VSQYKFIFMKVMSRKFLGEIYEIFPKRFELL